MAFRIVFLRYLEKLEECEELKEKVEGIEAKMQRMQVRARECVWVCAGNHHRVKW